MKIVVLGGGLQGSVVARDLAGSFDVTVADLAPPRLPGVRRLQADFSAGLDRLVSRFDLAVSAVPSALGLAPLEAAVEARRSLVDLTYAPQDPLTLDRRARRAGVTVVPDAGLSPGLSNVFVGRLASLSGGSPRRVAIRVGGIAADREQDYVVTWSLPDLLEEYTRPARIVRRGRVVEVPALSGVETIRIPGVGPLEGFLTDGLRTLLRTVPAHEMAEWTLRWPGHVGRIQALADLGLLAPAHRAVLLPALRAKWEVRSPQDLVALDVEVDGRRLTMTDRARGGLTAMARTTALTCAVIARVVAAGGLPAGVLAP
jgi:lysine 6-dehydrogenase